CRSAFTWPCCARPRETISPGSRLFIRSVLKALLASVLLLAAPLGAVESAAYLKSPEGVRSSALAGAFSSAAGSAESLWYNPAGLSGLRGAEASFTHSSLADAFDTDQ